MSNATRLRAFSAAVAKAVANGADQTRPSPRTVQSINAEVEQLRRKRMQEAGIKPVRIPKQAEKLRAAICALVRHLDEGKAPSAKRAASHANLSGKLAAKLAYRVPIKAEDMKAALRLMRLAPFVRQLSNDAGWQSQVAGVHKSLATLARTLKHAHLSLAGRAAKVGATQALPPGHWHGEARRLRAAGWTCNRIARHLGLNVKTVETFQRRERLQLE
jgi:hypothetical protein